MLLRPEELGRPDCLVGSSPYPVRGPVWPPIVVLQRSDVPTLVVLSLYYDSELCFGIALTRSYKFLCSLDLSARSGSPLSR